MRVHDTGPRAQPHDAEAARWGHDYGTRGGDKLERPFIEDTPTNSDSPAIETFFYRVRSWVRRAAR
jgi:hypothetical protein